MLHDHKTALYVLALPFEVAGLALLLAPDAAPYWRQLRAATVRRARTEWWRVVGWIRRLLRRPGPNVVIQVPTAKAGTAAALGIQVMRGKPPGTIAQKVAILIDRDQENQKRLNQLETTLEDKSAAGDRQLAALRSELITLIATESQKAVDRHRGQRILGTVLVAFGAVIGTLGNLA
jgi:hypothetical protein